MNQTNMEARTRSAPIAAEATLRRGPNGPRRRAEEVLEAAAAVFADMGFHGASTQDIADRLGMRQASLYYYFILKEVALELVCNARAHEIVMEALVAERTRALEAVEDQMVAVSRDWLGFHPQREKLFRRHG